MTISSKSPVFLSRLTESVDWQIWWEAVARATRHPYMMKYYPHIVTDHVLLTETEAVDVERRLSLKRVERNDRIRGIP